jgi:hypothetical protein
MKKRIVIILGLAVLLIVGLGALAIVRVNDVVKLLQPQIEAQIAKAVGAPVKIGQIDISLFPSAELLVKDVSLGDRQAPSIAAIKAKLSLRPLLSKKLDASEIRFERPSITLIKGKDGFSIRGLPRKPSTASPPADTASPPKGTAEREGPAPQESGDLQLHLERIVVSDGSVMINDVEAGTNTHLSAIDLDAGVQLQHGIVTIPQAELRAVLPEQTHLSLSTRSTTFTPDTNELNVPDAVVTTDAGKIRADATLKLDTQHGAIKISSNSVNIGGVMRHAAALAPSLIRIALDGTVATSGAEIKLAGPGAISFKAPLQLRDASINLSQGISVRGLSGDLALEGSTTDLRFGSQKLSLQLNQAPLTLALDGQLRFGSLSTLSLSRLDLQGFEGSARMPLTLELGTSQQIRTNIALKGMSIQKILSTFNPERAGNFSGTIASLNADVNGALSPGAPKLHGPGSLSIVKASLKEFNLPRAVLNSVGKGLPFLEEALVDKVPPEFRGIMLDPDTRIESLDSSFELQGDITMLRSLKVVGDIFALESSGSIARDGTLNLNTTLTFTEEFSRALARQVKDIGKVYDSKGRLVIPLTLQGRSPKLLVLPDLSKLMQTGAGRIIEREAGRAVDRALKNDSETAKQVKDLLGGILGR